MKQDFLETASKTLEVREKQKATSFIIAEIKAINDALKKAGAASRVLIDDNSLDRLNIQCVDITDKTSQPYINFDNPHLRMNLVTSPLSGQIFINALPLKNQDQLDCNKAAEYNAYPNDLFLGFLQHYVSTCLPDEDLKKLHDASMKQAEPEEPANV